MSFILYIFLAFLFVVLRFCLFYRKSVTTLTSRIEILHEIAQVRGMFVNVISHELRNPMATIYSSVDLLENYVDCVSDEEKSCLFENIRKSIHRMTKMMDDIVLIGQFQHKQISYLPKKTNILQLCSSFCEVLEPEKSRQRIQIQIDHRLPLFVNIDPSLVDLILTNLLSNALKYSDQLVQLIVKFYDDSLIFDVIDHGIGIPKDEIQKLSRLFGRCSNIGNQKGIGVGMFLVANCVRLHHGVLKIHSQQNQGTHFRVIIPVANV